jgi:hypothetical protein
MAPPRSRADRSRCRRSPATSKSQPATIARLDPRDAARGRPIRYYDIDEDEEPRAEYPSFTVWLLTEMRRRRR